MHRPRRTIRLAKWAGVGLCVLIAVAWAVSMWWAVGLNFGPRFAGGVESGVFLSLWSGGALNDFDWFSETARPRRLTPMFEWNPSGHSAVSIPLWWPLALLAVPTASLFWLDRRKPRPGFCACGYDLTGNVSGVCPECGREAEHA